MKAIEIVGLRKSFGGQEAVRGVSFSVERGSVTGFLGPNGAGKSTTLRMLLGLVEPTAGSARIMGKPFAEIEQPAALVGALLDGAPAHPKRSGRDHLRAVAAAAGVGRHRVGEVLEQVGLADAAGRAAGGYSLGMRQRLGLAAALLGDPGVLVLDEPANGLDPAGMRWLRTLLRERADAGGAVLLSSHLLGEIAHLADRVVVIDRGSTVAVEATADLIARAGSGSLEDVFLELTEGSTR